MIVADTGAIIALLDRSDAKHKVLVKLFDETGDRWVIPWAVVPEVDHIAGTRISRRVRRAFLEDIVAGAFNVVWGTTADFERAAEIDALYDSLALGIVDASVFALAERLRADAIVTLDMKHFTAVRPLRPIRLLPGN